FCNVREPYHNVRAKSQCVGTKSQCEKSPPHCGGSFFNGLERCHKVESRSNTVTEIFPLG
ncbi:MAG TPA: hypothetical protein VF173_21835, partial [Thermoanaerobaculia bacterium]|nr:hypothetical protein [Thermoanaerobaculia bacterium]